ncbi:MAG TPA: TPM domain-containing protein [Candidatus Elarobacter sp.]|jgi:uncharacterized protein
MLAVRWFLALMMVIGLGTAANGAEVPIPPSPTHWATDTTGFLTPETVDALDARLRAYESSSKHQVLVYVAPTTGATPTEDWTVRAFARWKVGRKGLDDGVVLFVFPADRKVRIEVGYGLEQAVPDATAARIIRDITPKLKAGQPDAAVTAGVDEILRAVGGEPRGTGSGARSDAAEGKNLDGPRGRAVPDPIPVSIARGSSRFGEIFGEIIGVLIGIAVVVGIIILIMKLPDPPKGTYIRSRGTDGWGLAGMLLGGVLGGVSAVSGFSGGGGMSGGGGATGSW